MLGDNPNHNDLRQPVRFCPICGGVNNWSNQIPDTMLVKCTRCGIRYDAAEVMYYQYREEFEPALSHRDLVNYYMGNIKERENRFKDIMEYIPIKGAYSTLVIGASVGVLNNVITTLYPDNRLLGIEASCRKIDMSHDIYDNISILRGFAEDLPFHNMFTTVILNNVMQDTDHPLSVLCNAYNAGLAKLYTRLFIIHTPEILTSRLCLSTLELISMIRLMLLGVDVELLGTIQDGTAIIGVR